MLNQLHGSFALKGTIAAPLTAAATLPAEGGVVFVNPTGGAFTLTLPSLGIAAGSTWIIWNVSTSTNAVTLATEGAETIHGGATLVGPNATREVVIFQADGTSVVAAQLAVSA
jgi:hypothetical protein